MWRGNRLASWWTRELNTRSLIEKTDRCLKRPAGYKGPPGLNDIDGLLFSSQVNLGAQQVTHSFLIIPECPAPLLGRDLLFKVNAQIHFDHGEISVLDGTRHPIQVLSLALRDKYRLYQPKPLMAIDPNVQPWVQKYPLA